MPSSGDTEYDYDTTYDYDDSDDSDYNDYNDENVGPEKKSTRGAAAKVTAQVTAALSLISQRDQGQGQDQEVEAAGRGYRVISFEDVTPIMKSLIAEVSVLLNIKNSVSEVLLRTFKWNKEVLFEQYCSLEGEKFWSTAGVTRRSTECLTQSPSNSTPKYKKAKEIFYCTICCDHDVLKSEGFQLDCGHIFCKVCYEGYLNNSIGDGPMCVRLTCPQYQCQCAISSLDVASLCSPEVCGNYTMYLTRNFIETSTTMRWCPFPGCQKVVLKEGYADNDITITCSGCAADFCFRCGKDNHILLTCELLEAWQLKYNSESENFEWIVSNTKKCPKCKQRIEKNGGCMHMSCKMCRHGFCWHCLQPWEARGHTRNHTNCSLHIPAEKKRDADDNPAEMERYSSHDKSIKFADMQREHVVSRMNKSMSLLKTTTSTYVDVEFLIQSVEQVIAGRKALKYAYAFVFFLVDGSPEKALLEHSLEMLEKHVESLSHLTEEICGTSPNGSVKDVLTQHDKDCCLNLTCAIKKSLATLLETRNENDFQFRS